MEFPEVLEECCIIVNLKITSKINTKGDICDTIFLIVELWLNGLKGYVIKSIQVYISIKYLHIYK